MADNFSMDYDDFSRGVYVIGGTGVGKSTTIQNIIDALLKKGFTVISVDPKGDDSLKMLARVKELDSKKVTFLDPVKVGGGFNPLELPAHDPADRDRVLSLQVGFFMNVIKQWYGKEMQIQAPRCMRILQSLLFALYAESDHPTLIDLYQMLVTLQRGEGAKLIKQFSSAAPDQAMILKRELGALGRLVSEAFDPPMTRLSPLAIDAFLRRMFSIKKSTIDFKEMLKPGRLTVLRLPRSEVGDTAQPLIMSMFICRLWLEVLYRAGDIPEEKRNPVILAIDEFQHSAQLGVLQVILSEARSSGLYLILSHQNLAQLPEEIRASVLANCATQISFRCSGDDAAALAKTWDPRYFKEITNELATLPDFVALVRLRASSEKEQQVPFRVEMSPPAPALHTPAAVAKFIGQMKALYGKVEAVVPIPAGQEDWKKFLPVKMLYQREWQLLNALNEKPLTYSATGARAGLPDARAHGAWDYLKNNQLIRVERSGASGIYYAPSKDGRALLDNAMNFKVVGGLDAQRLAQAAYDHYVGHACFVTVSLQEIAGERPDLVVYDYGDKAAAVECESHDEIIHRKAQVKANMIKWKDLGFSECHVWIEESDKAAVEALKSELPADLRADIKIFTPDEPHPATVIATQNAEATVPVVTAKGKIHPPRPKVKKTASGGRDA
jgi:hypothetical protein